ncbi:hypothetical protein RclHR1_01370023 [Rhizophagus clarus]|uniref:BTB domain-containing protein n=1 Tax=Rhizophagus clarus TaxID=94130 RepID=A0A2Z6QQM4_9GLOM|nr:hypothetical protein RclHR1_01370023 [Rhizophagus clarus]
MSTQFFSKLSQNYIEILEDDEYYDVTIEVGEDPNVKIFRAHVIILCHRSPFLRRTLASNKNNNNTLSHIKLSNISPEIFQIILRYIYGGIFSSNGLDTLDIFKVLIAADELYLQELVDYLQNYFIENKSEWIEQNFELTYRTSFQSNNFSVIQQFCTDLMAEFPEKIFKSLDFTSISEKSLISLIKRDDLQMREVEVWEHVLKWGLAQNQTLIPNPDTWTDEDFKMMKNTLQHYLPLIRFFSLSPKEFLHKVRPYKKLFEQQFYEELLSSYLDIDSKPSDDILLPRNLKIDGIIESNIVNLNIVTLISRWIDKVDIDSKFAHLRELYLPYKFELLYKNEEDFFPTNSQLYNKYDTLSLIKMKETGEIIGSYIPLKLKVNGPPWSWDETKNSFIFYLKNKNDLESATFCGMKNKDHVIYDGKEMPRDLLIFPTNNNSSGFIRYKHKYYEKKIMDTEGKFPAEVFEVFQVKRK